MTGEFHSFVDGSKRGDPVLIEQTAKPDAKHVEGMGINGIAGTGAPRRNGVIECDLMLDRGVKQVGHAPAVGGIQAVKQMGIQRKVYIFSAVLIIVEQTDNNFTDIHLRTFLTI